MLVFSLLLLLSLASLKKVLFWTGLWQTKEYRRDRLTVHLKETSQGKSLFTSTPTIVGILLLLSYAFVIMYDWFGQIFQLLVVFFFLFYVFDFLKDILDKKIKRPTFTYKSLAIMLLSLGFPVVLFFFPLTDKYLWTLFLLGSIPFVVSFWVLVFSFPSELYTDYLSQKAQKKIKKLKNLTVIAVSGSYGKSSTKEAIAGVLSQKFSVVKTPLSNNTSIGIAKTILNNIDEMTQFFIVEMGAYKMGEIAQLCTIVRPHISVTTSVSDQHISLYGSFENVISSEKELLSALPKSGIALFNANNKNTLLLANKTKQKKIFYKTSSKPTAKGNTIIGYDITPKTDGTLCTVMYKNHTLHMKTSLLGEHVVENMLPAIFLGLHAGMTDKEIQKGIAQLKPLPHTMQQITLKNSAVGIDDTFNASPESVASAAAYLSFFPKKKFFVLTPLIELGKFAYLRHKEIGQVLANVDYIFVTNKNHYKDIEVGIKSKGGQAILIYGSYPEITHMIERFAKKGDVVMFEGKEAGVVLKKLV